MLTSLLLAEDAANQVSFTYPVLAAAVAVFVGVFAVVTCMLLIKQRVDADKAKLSDAAGGARWVAGLPHLANLLTQAASGNVKRTFKAALELYEKYFTTARGPLTMVFDVFMAGWPQLHGDKEYADQVIAKVVSTGLSIDINDDLDIKLAKKAGLIEAMWPKLTALALIFAGRHWSKLGPALRALFDEIMEDNGEVKIAQRVATPTFDMLWDNTTVPGAHDTAQKLVEKYAARLGWTPPVPVKATAPTAAAA